MDEKTEVLAEDTTPTEETAIQSQPTDIEEPSGAPQTEEKPTDVDSNNAEEVQDIPADDSLTLQFNHESVKVPRDEAIRLAQYGMYLEKLGKGYKENVNSIISDLMVIQEKTTPIGRR